MKPPTSSSPGGVVDLHRARRAKRLDLYRSRQADRVRTVRATLETLTQSGTLFTKEGTRRGLSLLKALQLLQRIGARLEEASGDGVLPAPRRPERMDALYVEVDELFERADKLAGRDEASVARLPGH
ncbi:hypothetical protein [Pyxidicoccus xibeiensis]|uniref:hypothetical protein n=1 Tax=Pyxidicoccus xibeiensis TaxID=2906759 RepID=UPI0020A80872|nr:hypothetical protein [Pyxidicoccus xibeiensis]MCP3145281.1 hypothetical protein [Pyxidicoccus xibeiensis]